MALSCSSTEQKQDYYSFILLPPSFHYYKNTLSCWNKDFTLALGCSLGCQCGGSWPSCGSCLKPCRGRVERERSSVVSVCDCANSVKETKRVRLISNRSMCRKCRLYLNQNETRLLSQHLVKNEKSRHFKSMNWGKVDV